MGELLRDDVQRLVWRMGELLRDDVQRLVVLREELLTALLKLDAPLKAAQIACDTQDHVNLHRALESCADHLDMDREGIRGVVRPLADVETHVKRMLDLVAQTQEHCREAIVRKALYP